MLHIILIPRKRRDILMASVIAITRHTQIEAHFALGSGGNAMHDTASFAKYVSISDSHLKRHHEPLVTAQSPSPGPAPPP